MNQGGRRMNKAMKFLLMMICCVSMLSYSYTSVEGKTSMKRKTLEIESASVDEVIITIKDCNVDLAATDSNIITCKYDKKRSKVKLSQNQKRVTIKVEGGNNNDYCFVEDWKDKVNRRCTIYLPVELLEKKVEIHADRAGVGIKCEMKGKTTIVGEESAMSYSVPEDFEDKISMELTNCSGSLRVPKSKLKEIYVEDHNCALSCPPKVKKNNKKDAKITINLSNCSFSLGAD